MPSLHHRGIALLYGIIVFTCSSALAQSVIATVPVGHEVSSVVLNPVTQKLYIANLDNTLTVMDENTLETSTVPIGFAYIPTVPMVLNKRTNKIYVANTCGNDRYCGSNGTVTVIDGATLATTTIQVGLRPEAIAVNEETNQIFVVNACGYQFCTYQSLSIIDGTTLAVTTVGTWYGYYAIAPSVAVNPVTNKVYVVNPCGTNPNCTQGNITLIDPVTLANVSVPVGLMPTAVAVDSTTDKIYVANSVQYTGSSVTVIDGATHSATTVPLHQAIVSLGVNESTNTVYAVSGSDRGDYGELAVIDGATLATGFHWLPQDAFTLAISTTSNKLYIASEIEPFFTNGYLTVMDASTFDFVNVTVGPSPVGVVVDDATNRIYTVNACASLMSCGVGAQGAVSVLDGSPPPAWRFIPVSPCRVVDTRNPDGTFGGPSIQGGAYRDFPVPQGACSIPDTATAYALNVTVIPHAVLNYLTIWPSGQPRPVISTMNSLDGRTKANAAVAIAGNNEAVSVYATDTTDVALDISGYFVPLPNNDALAFYPLAPCRVADTRNANGPLGGPILQGGQPRSFPVLQATQCDIPDTAQAYSLNFTVVPASTLSYLTVWPSGEQRPLVSILNDGSGTITANAAIVPAGENGEISAFATEDTQLVIDINGYFAPPGNGGLSFYGPPPCRVVDTRRQSPGPFNGTASFDIAYAGCSTPSTAPAFLLNATVIPQQPLGYLTLWPDGQQRPLVSTLNALDRAITSNMAIVPSGNSSIDAYASGLTYLVLDISGYFAP